MLRRFLLWFILACLLLLTPALLVESVRNVALRSIAPLGRFLISQNVATRNFWANLTQIGQLREEKQNLQLQVVSLEQQLIEQESIRTENQALRQQLGVSDTTKSSKKVLGRVIVQGANPLDRTFTIDAGSDQGIKVGQPAISQGALVGRVISVRSSSAVIRSITSQQSRVQARIAQNQEKGLLVGDGNGVSLQDITQGVAVAAGSVVETSGLGGSLPQGLLIGTTGTLQSAKSELSQSFQVVLTQDISNIQDVFVLLVDTQ